VDKTSRSKFEMRTHKRLLDIVDPTPQTVDSLMKLDPPGGVDVEIKTIAADENRPSASLPPRSSLRRMRHTPQSSLVGASHLGRF